MSYHLCPVCGSPLRQIHRRTIDRLISQFYRVHRFRCSNDECRWVGLKLDFLSSYYINARYKEDLDQLSKGMSDAVVQDFIQFSEGLITWLCQKIK
jgi:hypothetical protein